MTLRTNLPNRCKHCKVRMPADKARHVLHDDCIDPWLVIQQGKKKLKAAKEKRAAAVKERKADKEKLKSRSDWAREAQAAFNGWARLRDADQPCISCGRHHQGQYHAGHYLSVGARPELRFEPLNVHKQCAPCNTHLSGNAVLFRKALLVKIGLEQLDWLEGPHQTRHYSVDDFKDVKTIYATKIKQLKETA